MAGLKVPAVLGERIRKRITRDEKVAAIEDLQARLLESIVEDDVIGEATLQQRVTSFAILEDKLGAIEAKPAPALRSEAREKVLGLLARLEERRRRQEGAVDVKATEVRK